MAPANQDQLTNSSADQQLLRVATFWGLAFVSEVLPIFEANYPDDSRPRQALAVTTKYVQGEKRGQALRQVSMAVFKIGKEVTEPAKYVTRAVSALAAVPYTHTDLRSGDQGWRQARHVLGPIVYAAYALELAGQAQGAGDDLIERAITAAPPEVRTIIRQFPPQPDKRMRLDELFQQLDAGFRA
ncbi:putative immunity protein [Lapidilactobacillus luobeiensis]|uniref:putative immunity protein n=1 Tax=Lapidilactobacillus luobeiensis TaxID=2950371 RepID=UPI0021C412B4|nr:hypothetical protein [Lapidilactobacillus luobeiensis]